MPPVECAGLGLFLWLARILSGSGPWLPLVHAQPQSLLGWHTPLASRGRRTVSTTTHQNLQEACMHYCDGIKFVTRIRTAARARNLVLRVLWFRLEWHKHAPRHDRQQQLFCVYSRKWPTYGFSKRVFNIPAATPRQPLNHPLTQTTLITAAQLGTPPRYTTATSQIRARVKDHHAIDKYEWQFPQYKPLWPPATCQQRLARPDAPVQPPPCVTEKVSSHPGAQGDGGPPW